MLKYQQLSQWQTTIANLIMHKNLTNLNLEDLKQCAPERLQTQSVTAVLLALGSNYQAEKYLPRACKQLATLGEIQLSTAFQNPDFTATLQQPKPDYTNQCVYLTFTSAITLQQLQQTFKQFESDCGRQRYSESIKNSIKIVTMDIDILLVKLDDRENSLSKNTAFKNTASKKIIENSEQWIIMADRYPFKTHEIAGIEELVLSEFAEMR